MDNIVLGMDLFESRRKEKIGEQQLKEMTEELLCFEKNTEQNNAKWLQAISSHQESIKTSFALLLASKAHSMIEREYDDDDSVTTSSVINKEGPASHETLTLLNFLKKESNILQKQNEILRKYLQQENEEHIETAMLLDRALEYNRILTSTHKKDDEIKRKRKHDHCHCKSKVKDQHDYKPTSSDLLLSKQIQCIHWHIMANNAMTKYYTKKVIFFAECKKSIDLFQSKCGQSQTNPTMTEQNSESKIRHNDTLSHHHHQRMKFKRHKWHSSYDFYDQDKTVKIERTPSHDSTPINQ